MAADEKELQPLSPDEGKDNENLEDILQEAAKNNKVENIYQTIANELKNISNWLIETKESNEKLFGNILNELKESNYKLSSLLDFQKSLLETTKNFEFPIQSGSESKTDVSKTESSNEKLIESLDNLSKTLKYTAYTGQKSEQSYELSKTDVKEFENVLKQESYYQRQIFGQLLGANQFAQLYPGAEEQVEGIMERLDAGRLFGESLQLKVEQESNESINKKIQSIYESITSPFSYPVMLKRIVPGYELSEIVRELEFGRMMSSPIGAITLSTMMGLILPLQFTMFAPLTEPMRTYSYYRDVVNQIAEAFTPIHDIVDVVYDVLKESPLERYENMYLTQMILTSSLQSVQAANQTVRNALILAKTSPLEFKDIMQAFRSLAVYPSVKPYLSSYEFQKKLADVVSGLSLINPEQGVSGALFSLIEALSGSLRSLQMRFNISPDIIASLAGMSKEEMSSSPVKLIEGLHKFIEKSIGTDILEKYSYTFTKQVGNLEDTFNMFVKQTFESTQLYSSITSLAIALNSIASSLISNRQVQQGVEYILEPITSSILQSLSSITGISPDILQTLSFADIETLVAQKLSNMSPKEIADSLESIVDNLGEGFSEFKRRLQPVIDEANKVISSSISALSQNILYSIESGVKGFALHMLTHPGDLVQMLLATAMIAAPVMLAHKGMSKLFEVAEYSLISKLLKGEVEKANVGIGSSGSSFGLTSLVSAAATAGATVLKKEIQTTQPQFILSPYPNLISSAATQAESKASFISATITRAKDFITGFNRLNVFERFMYGLTAGELYNMFIGNNIGFSIPDLAIIGASIASPYITSLRSTISKVSNVIKSGSFLKGGGILSAIGTAYSIYDYYQYIKEQEQKQKELDRVYESVKNMPYISDKEVEVIQKAINDTNHQSFITKVIGHIGHLLQIGGSALSTVSLFAGQPEFAIAGLALTGIGYGMNLLSEKLSEKERTENTASKYVLTMSQALGQKLNELNAQLKSPITPVDLKPVIQEQIEQTKTRLDTLLQAYKAYTSGSNSSFEAVNPIVAAQANLLRFLDTKNVGEFVNVLSNILLNNQNSKNFSELLKVATEQLNELQKNKEYTKKISEIFTENKELTQNLARLLVNEYFKTDDNVLKNQIDKLVSQIPGLKTALNETLKQEVKEYTNKETLSKLFESGNVSEILKVGRLLAFESKYDETSKQILEQYQKEYQELVSENYPELAAYLNKPEILANVEAIPNLSETEKEILKTYASIANIEPSSLEMKEQQYIEQVKQVLPFMDILPKPAQLTIGKQLAEVWLSKAEGYLAVNKPEMALSYLTLAEKVLPKPILKNLIHREYPELMDLSVSALYKLIDKGVSNVPSTEMPTMSIPELPKQDITPLYDNPVLNNVDIAKDMKVNVDLQFNEPQLTIVVKPDMDEFSEKVALQIKKTEVEQEHVA